MLATQAALKFLFCSVSFYYICGDHRPMSQKYNALAQVATLRSALAPMTIRLLGGAEKAMTITAIIFVPKIYHIAGRSRICI